MLSTVSQLCIFYVLTTNSNIVDLDNYGLVFSIKN